MLLELTTSKHFKLQQIGEGILVAIAIEDGIGAAYSNAGVVDLGKQLLIFDAFFTPAAAADLRRIAEASYGRSVTTLINSHIHGDHVLGNQVYADTTIIATDTTRDEFVNRLQPEMTTMSQDASGLSEWLDGLRQQLNQTDDPAQQKILSDRITRQEKLLAALPDLIPTPPTLTFKEQITFHGSKRTAVLQSFGACHSASDSILILPDDGVIFMGDLLFVQCQPYMGDGDYGHWLEVLPQIQAMDASTLVPGHGPIGSTADCDQLASYMTAMGTLAQQVVAEGTAVEEAITQNKPPSPYEQWPSDMFEYNLRALVERLSPTQETESG